MTQYLRQSPLIITVDGRCKYKKEIFDLIRQMQVDLADASGSQLIFSIPTLNTSAVLAQRASVLIKKNKIGPVKPHYIRQSDAEIKWKL
jgi:hypothetical protein